MSREQVIAEFRCCQTQCRDCTDGCPRGGEEPYWPDLVDEIVSLRARLAKAETLVEAARDYKLACELGVGWMNGVRVANPGKAHDDLLAAVATFEAEDAKASAAC